MAFKLNAQQKAAAEALGFRKVNKQSELDQINAYIASGNANAAPAQTQPLTKGDVKLPDPIGLTALNTMSGSTTAYSREQIAAAAAALGIQQVNKPEELQRIETYLNAFEKSKQDPLYLANAQRMGIENYNSINDYMQVIGGMQMGGGTNAAQASSKPQNTLDDYIAQAQETIKNLQNQQVQPYPDPNVAIQQALAAQAAQFEQQIANQNAQYQQQIGNQSSQYQQQMAALQELMIQQQNQFQQQIGTAQQQQQMAAAQAAEAQRQSEALQRAFVPNLEPTAAAAGFGDSRTGANTRTSAANTLSNLAILTGLNGMGSAGVTSTLAGLQIA